MPMQADQHIHRTVLVLFDELGARHVIVVESSSLAVSALPTKASRSAIEFFYEAAEVIR